NINKSKAAVAECRSIATAMSFAYDDLGFFPKICFLRFGLEELSTYIVPMSNTKSVEYHGIDLEDGLPNRLRKNWKQKYMSGSEPGKTVYMHSTTDFGGEPPMQWPADPFGTPYVAYLMTVDNTNPG